MRDLSNFINNLNEAQRGRPRKNPVVTDDTPSMKEIQGKPADDFVSGSAVFGLDEPTDDEPIEPLDKATMSRNMKRLYMKFKAEEDFFILGEAGWGKTSIIKNMAKRFKRRVLTVYLDKAQASDLGGIPIPVQGEKRINGKRVAQQEMAMPGWAAIMLENPDTQFLLFFDEMNQAQPDVMNALMPIVLEHEVCGVKFDNFFVGAAGNFEHENKGGVSQLGGPLKSRFKPIIVWDSSSEGSWQDAFNYLHKKYDSIMGKDLIDLFAQNATLFQNPREIEHKIFKLLIKLKKNGETDMFDPEDYLDRLENLIREDLERSQLKMLPKLAQACFDWVNNISSSSRTSEKKRGRGGLPKNIQDAILNGMTKGYFEVKGITDSNGQPVKFGVSRENIYGLDLGDAGDDPQTNRDMIERYIKKLEEEGKKFKFEKDSQWKEKGYADEETWGD